MYLTGTERRKYLAPEVHLCLRRGDKTLGALWISSEAAFDPGSAVRAALRDLGA